MTCSLVLRLTLILIRLDRGLAISLRKADLALREQLGCMIVVGESVNFVTVGSETSFTLNTLCFNFQTHIN